MARVGFVGLGVMGGPMARHLISGGYEVTVWNRTPSKAEPHRNLGAEVAPDLQILGECCETIFLCVNRTEDVRACLDQLTVRAEPGTLFVDHSTILPRSAQEIHEDLGRRGFGFVDAPITGGSVGAQNGQLTVFCGGREGDVDEIMPMLQTYSRRAERVGGPGSGQLMKMANQIAVGGALLALCESLSFAKKAGLDLAQTRDLLNSGAAGSWALEFYGTKILDEDWTPGFSIENQRKDFGYCLETARGLNAALPGTALVDELLSDLDKKGQGDLTTAALYLTLLRMGHES
jgi:3-hydroxyisobutyrate dehydrogenase